MTSTTTSVLPVDAAGVGAVYCPAADVCWGDAAVGAALRDVRRPVAIVAGEGGRLGAATRALLEFGTPAAVTAAADVPGALHGKNGASALNGAGHKNSSSATGPGSPAAGAGVGADRFPCLGWAGALHPETFGSAAFRRAHGVKYAYVAGAMANGIASERLVIAMGSAGMLAFFGAAGLAPARIARAIDEIQAALDPIGAPYGFNLIHSPAEPMLEAETVELYLRRGVRRISAAAFLDLTLPLVRYRVAGVHRSADGRVVAPNKIVATVSRVEVASKLFAPPPEDMLRELVARGLATPAEAELAREIPMCGDLTAESDSGGHTDNRPAITLYPTMAALRDTMQARYGFAEPLRVGLAGGIATPAGLAAAFSMGAAYVVTGTINQSCVESGTSDAVRKLLAEAGQADVIMAPAADMFEMGVKVQVLKWGTMFPVRARKLYDWYRAYDSVEALPAAVRASLEREFLKCSIDEAWASTCAFFEGRDPSQIERANRDPKHKLALLFRSYLGRSSEWATKGDPTRKSDYQVWCGPAMGAFNEWVKGSFLEPPARREVVVLALNLLAGAAVLSRATVLRNQGVALPATAETFRPMERAELDQMLGGGVA